MHVVRFLVRTWRRIESHSKEVRYNATPGNGERVVKVCERKAGCGGGIEKARAGDNAEGKKSKGQG